MRVRTLEIRWHDSKPISTCDFQPVPFKKARPAHEKHFATQSYKLATGGEDNHVRLWTVHPNILPRSVVETASGSAAEAPTPRPPRVEYLATLARHSAPVNVVRWSPNGELIASAGDDGMIIIWAPTTSPHTGTYGSDLSAEELQYEKEHWKPRTTFRCTTMQVYDLAWSPTGEYIIAGSTDNCARIFATGDGKCITEIAEHSHYVQGVAWDPLNEFIATQSSDRSMHIYSITQKDGTLELHAVGKNTRMNHRHSRTPSSRSRPPMLRRDSTTSETESVLTNASEQLRDQATASGSGSSHQLGGSALLTPTASVPSTPSSMFPPPPLDYTPSRRSSFSSTTAANSPAAHGRFGRSPSPMPALPAIRTQTSSSSWGSVKLYGDENYTNFFRRLTFSPDGGLLATPAGQFEDPSVNLASSKTKNGKDDETPSRGRRGNPSAASNNSNQASTSTVYIYSRANFANQPIFHLPGHKKPSIAVKFSPILYELRPGVTGPDWTTEPMTIAVEKGKDVSVKADYPRPASNSLGMLNTESPVKSTATPAPSTPIVAPSPRIAIPSNSQSHLMMPSPALSATDSLRPFTPSFSRTGTPAVTPAFTASLLALSYRMLYAVATMDTVIIYDTQQAGPVCLLTKLHYDEFTDMTWSPDGQCLMLSSRDGYCTIVVFDEIFPTHHTQQQTLQLQSIAHHHSLPLTSTSTVATPMSTPSVQSTALPATPAMTPVVPGKRKAEVEPPLTPAPSVDESALGLHDADEAAEVPERVLERPKKKRRAALTHIGDVGS